MLRVGIGKFGIVGIGLIGVLAAERSLSLPLEHRSLEDQRLEQRRIEPSPPERSPLRSPLEQRPAEKITFDLATISAAGLATATGGGSVSYEFCIPATEAHVSEVKAIDPSLETFAHSRGRIGCQREEYLCIGNTHQDHWREKLIALASLNYIQRIDRFWGE